MHAEKDRDRRWGVGLWRIFRLQIQAYLPATTFLRSVDLSGKTIIPFCTHPKFPESYDMVGSL